jgi:hypothetical protein
MKKLLSLAIAASFIGITAMTLSGIQDRIPNDGIRDRFVGAWRLAWLEEVGADGKLHRPDCTGLLVYTRDGHRSVQVMYRNRQARTTAAPVQYAQGGYEPLLAHIRSTNARTPSPFMLRAHSCES